MKNQIRKILSILLGTSVALGMISGLFAPIALAEDIAITSVEVNLPASIPLINPKVSPNAKPTSFTVIISGNGGETGFTNGRLEYVLERTGFTDEIGIIIYKSDGTTVFNPDASEVFSFNPGQTSTTVSLGIKATKIREIDYDYDGFAGYPGGQTIYPGKITFQTTTPKSKSSDKKDIGVALPKYCVHQGINCDAGNPCCEGSCTGGKCAAGAECAAVGESCETKPCCAGVGLECKNKICVKTGEPVPTGVCETTCDTQFAGFPDKIKTCREKCCVRGEQNLCNASCDIYFAVPDDQSKCKTACSALSSSAIITKSTEVESLITAIARWIAIIISVIAVIFIILGGVSYVTAGGDAEKAKGAKSKIIYGLIGLGVAALAWGAEALVRSVLSLK